MICAHLIKLCSPHLICKSHFWQHAGHLSLHLHFCTISVCSLSSGFEEILCERVHQKAKAFKKMHHVTATNQHLTHRARDQDFQMHSLGGESV